MKCQLQSGICRATCVTDYAFPNKQTSMSVNCIEGEWTIENTELPEIPSCEPICLPECQNNGICISPGECDCSENFMGPQCQTKKEFCMNSPNLPANSRRSCTSS